MRLGGSKNPDAPVEDFLKMQQEAKNDPTKAAALEDWHKATIQLRKDKEALDEAKFKASQDKDNPVNRIKLKSAQAAAERSAAYMMRAQAATFGTYNGKPLPGAVVTAEGDPVGSAFQGNVKPTSTEIGRADLAGSALDQMDTMGQILLKRPDLFGPVAGRATDFTQWVGSQDPDALQFRAAARVAADHLAGVFGGRSEAALQHIYEVIGQNKTNPEAAIVALDQMGKAAKLIKQKGTRNTVGGVAGDTGKGGSGVKNALTKPGKAWSPPANAPDPSGLPDGKVLKGKTTGKVIAVSKGGKWTEPPNAAEPK